MGILSPVFLILFWAAALAFVPITFYLLIKNPPLYKADRISSRGIFIISEESQVKKSKKSRIKTAGLIYAACLVFFSSIYFLNGGQESQGIKPFDVLSTVSIILFWFSILTYLPIAVYLLMKNPWQHKEEAVCLTSIYISYGIAVLIFSLIFLSHWLTDSRWRLGTAEIWESVLTIIVGASILSYVPILTYIFLRISRVYKSTMIHFNTIFVIYSICFLLFSGIYLVNWVSDRKSGLKYKSWADHFRPDS